MPTFLVVEDHEPLARAMATLLCGSGTVHIALSFRQAMQLLRHQPWTAAFIDVLLPDGNGLDVLKRLRTGGCLAPAMVLTAHCEPAIANHAHDLDARLAIKPLQPARIHAFARRAIHGDDRLARALEVWHLRYGLSVAELTILELAARGCTQEQIALQRDVARETIKRQIKTLLAKTLDDTLAHAALRLWNESS